MSMGIKSVFAVTLLAALAQGCGGVEGAEWEDVGSGPAPAEIQESQQVPSTSQAPEEQVSQAPEGQDSRVVTAAGITCSNLGSPFCGALDVGCWVREGKGHAQYQRQLCYNSDTGMYYTADNHVGCC